MGHLPRVLSVSARLVGLLLLLFLFAAVTAFAAAEATASGDDGDGAPTTATTASVPSQHEQTPQQQQQSHHSPWRVSPLPQSGLEKGESGEREEEAGDPRRPQDRGRFFLSFFLSFFFFRGELSKLTKTKKNSSSKQKNRNRFLPARRFPRCRGHGHAGRRRRLLRRSSEGSAFSRSRRRGKSRK